MIVDIPFFPGPRLARLLDGTLAWNDTEQFRHEREAREMLALSSLARSARLAAIASARGPEVAAAFRLTLREIEDALGAHGARAVAVAC